jgi:NAD(P)-dependent dehydrogenase (short-subunit alcohol dehydrogenase family)
VIAPSLSYSKMSQPLLGNEAMAKGIAQMHPLGRLGVADDFSALAEVLLDNKLGGWMTGSVFPVDGGRASVQAPQRAR